MLFIDRQGNPRAQGEDEALCGFLEQDVQGSVRSCDWFLERLEEVVSSSARLWEGTGNAFSVTIHPDKIMIESEFASPVLRTTLSVDDFRRAIQDWKRLIEGLQSS